MANSTINDHLNFDVIEQGDLRIVRLVKYLEGMRGGAFYKALAEVDAATKGEVHWVGGTLSGFLCYEGHVASIRKVLKGFGYRESSDVDDQRAELAQSKRSPRTAEEKAAAKQEREIAKKVELASMIAEAVKAAMAGAKA